MRTLIILSALVEAALLLGGGVYALSRLRRWRSAPSAETIDDPAPEAARPPVLLGRLEKVLTIGLPLPLARLLMLEPRLWWCFGAWVLRRGPKGSTVFSYRTRSPLGLLILVMFFTTPVEVLLFELLIPVLWIRVVLLVVAAYGLFFIVAMYASLVVLPHLVTDAGLLVRYGTLVEMWVPFDRIASATAEKREGPRGSLGFPREGLSIADDEASFLIGGRTDLVVEFDRLLPLARLRGDRLVRRVLLAVDAPDALLAALQSGIARAAISPRAAKTAMTASRSTQGDAPRQRPA